MKKSLLFSAALVAAGSAFAGVPAMRQADVSAFSVGPRAKTVTAKAPKATTRAMESFDFTYAEEVYSGLSLNNTVAGQTRVFMLFEMAPEDIKTFAGSKVTGFTVCSPVGQNGAANTITEGRFFYTTDPTLSKEDYTQNFSMSSTPFEDNKVDIETPYVITGEEESLFFGYSVVVKKNMFYVMVDCVPNAASTGMLGISPDGESMPEEYDKFGNSEYGALCMSITLEREHLPKFVSFVSMPSTVCLPLGEPSTLPVTLKATSGSPIESISMEYTLGGKLNEATYVLDTPIPAGASRYFDLNMEFPAQDVNLNEQVEFTLTKINGEANVSEGATATATVVVVDEVPVHQTLYEEYTSTSCGYCTRGFAALEHMRTNYPEFVTASFHTSYQSVDPMQAVSKFPTQVSGYPSAVLNRTTQVDPYYGTQQYMNLPLPVVGDMLALNAVPTPWRVAVTHEWETPDQLVAKAEVANVAGFEKGNYKIAYLLVADGLSGKTAAWRQSNYYSTDAPNFIPELNAFCRGGEYGKSYVSGLIYNDVVVSPNGIHGEAGSIPTSLAPEESASHSLTFDLSKISSTLIPDRNKLRVIAIVLDKDGSVLNCAKDEVNDYDEATTGVADMVEENAPVEYFNLNGVKVANPTEGIFIRRQGGKAEKVIMK